MKYPISFSELGFVRTNLHNSIATFYHTTSSHSMFYSKYRRMTWENFKREYPLEMSFGGGFRRCKHKKDKY